MDSGYGLGSSSMPWIRYGNVDSRKSLDEILEVSNYTYTTYMM